MDPRLERQHRWGRNVSTGVSTFALGLTALSVAISGLTVPTLIAFVLIAMTFYLGVMAR
jgi:hypothetical protein